MRNLKKNKNNSISFQGKKLGVLGIIFSLALGITSGSLNFLYEHNYINIEKKGEKNVCFTPHQKCLPLIIREINKAQESIHILAYSFTSKPIFEALNNAAERGVIVHALLDKSNVNDQHSIFTLSRHYNFKIYIDRTTKGISHNKVMIFDRKIVEKGSYNYSNAAEYRNAENVEIEYNEELAKAYLDNWEFLYNRTIHQY